MMLLLELKEQLNEILIEIEADNELMYGMIDYFKRCFDRDKELNVEMILQVFKAIWDSFDKTFIKNYRIITDIMKMEEQ